MEFITILLWESIDAVRTAAGHADYETAIIPEERRKYLAHFDANPRTMRSPQSTGLPACDPCASSGDTQFPNQVAGGFAQSGPSPLQDAARACIESGSGVDGVDAFVLE